MKKEIIRAYVLKNAIAHDGKAQVGSVVAGLFNHGLKKEKIKDYIKEINKIISEVNKLSLENKKKEFEKLKKFVGEREVREGLAELPGAKKGKVVMRISPAPSGPMHIGNAIVGALNYVYVKKYGGKFYVRIEDTNPENIYKPAYDLIKKDSAWLFEKKAKVVVQSERMKIYYSYAEKLIKKKAAYVCSCSGDDFREFVGQKKDCPCRKFSLKENLERWKKMLSRNGFDVGEVPKGHENLSKGFGVGEAVLRFKSSMQDKNPAMRDFPLARINETPHPLQKKKYRVWPLMNLAVIADDIEMKVTHIIRGKDHRDNAERQKMIFKVLGKNYPWCAFIGRYKFKDFELSKRKIAEGIKSGKYKSWDDENLPTVSALMKKGYKPSAFWKFAEHIGLTEVDKVIEKKDFFDVLDRFN